MLNPKRFRPLSGIMFLHTAMSRTVSFIGLSFRPLSGIMFLHDAYIKGIASRKKRFPSPVGDYVSSLEEEFAVKDEYKAVSVPCRGLCFFTWDDITINQKVADFCFRPLSGIMFLHNYKKFTLEGGEVGFRPLSGIMFLHEFVAVFHQTSWLQKVSVPCRGLCFFTIQKRIFKLPTEISVSVPCLGLCFFTLVRQSAYFSRPPILFCVANLKTPFFHLPLPANLPAAPPFTRCGAN